MARSTVIGECVGCKRCIGPSYVRDWYDLGDGIVACVRCVAFRYAEVVAAFASEKTPGPPSGGPGTARHHATVPGQQGVPK